jgi:hypothetical protein
VTLVDDALWAATPPERLLRLSGWGRTETTTRPLVLQAANLPLKSDPFCDAQYDGLLTTELMLCAGDGLHDSCNGDSGGPLALNAGTSAAPAWRLVGIVSFGGQSGCGSDTQYGVYTEVAAPRIRAFLQRRDRAERHDRAAGDEPADVGQTAPAVTTTAPAAAPAVTAPAQTDTVARWRPSPGPPAHGRAACSTCAWSTRAFSRGRAQRRRDGGFHVPRALPRRRAQRDLHEDPHASPARDADRRRALPRRGHRPCPPGATSSPCGPPTSRATARSSPPGAPCARPSASPAPRGAASGATAG